MMKLTKFSKTLVAAALIGIAGFGASSMADAQYRGYGMRGGGMGSYGGGMMGGYGGGMMAGYGPGPGSGYEGNRQPADPGLNTRAGRLFGQTCSQCHGLPDPRQHSAGQWPVVVARMEQHMRERSLPLPRENAIKDIDAFLEQHTNGR
jgi:hypothetical protein